MKEEYTFTFTEEEIGIICKGIQTLEQMLVASSLKSEKNHAIYHEIEPKLIALAEKIANVVGVEEE